MAPLPCYVASSINFMLATKDKATWPQDLHDYMTAVRWLRKNADRLQIGPPVANSQIFSMSLTTVSDGK